MKINLKLVVNLKPKAAETPQPKPKQKIKMLDLSGLKQKIKQTPKAVSTKKFNLVLDPKAGLGPVSGFSLSKKNLQALKFDMS